ncbi:MAG: hypothetical protein NTV94_16155, partial [Planctomycetota bacterium]|nr:hypothetical protein [Planctomycetota bacterium]
MNNLISRLVTRVGTPRSIVAAAGTKPAHVPAFESLEQRQMMALLGVTLSQLPIEFYNATGQLRYEAASGSFDVVATPTSVLLPTGPRAVVGATHGDFQIHARLTNAGNLARGVVAGDSAVIGAVDSAGNDFIVRGSIDLDGNGSINPATESGTLLTGELLAFGWRDSGGPTDQYDYKFLVTGGLLAPLYGLRDGGITMTSEASTFAGDFGVNFQGQAKGSVGPIAAPAASSISGFVYEDDSNDGVFDTGEAAIPGTLITLTGVNDAGQAVTRTTSTNGSGFYSFANLRPGTYRITEAQPAAYLDGKDTIGTPGGTTANDAFSDIVLNAGVNGTNNNFGEVRPASVSGYVYVDANNDGNFDGGESAIQSVLVTLNGTDDLGNSVSLTASTNAAGFYSFGNLRPGTYALTESQPAGYLDGKDTIGTPGGSTANDAFSAISLVAGFNGVNNNFGEILASSISGYVYVDANNDGNFDGSESAIQSVLVTLNGTDDLGNSVSLVASTNAAGFYSFGNLRPGTYALTESQPA